MRVGTLVRYQYYRAQIACTAEQIDDWNEHRSRGEALDCFPQNKDINTMSSVVLHVCHYTHPLRAFGLSQVLACLTSCLNALLSTCVSNLPPKKRTFEDLVPAVSHWHEEDRRVCPVACHYLSAVLMDCGAIKRSCWWFFATTEWK